MRARTVLLTFAAVASLAIAGCAAITQRIDPHAGCDSGSHVCQVAIAVNSCGSGETITATPSTRHVPPGTWVVQWTISTPGYEFAEDGIELAQNPGGIFIKRGKTGANGFQWVDNNRAEGGPYKYNVHILKNGVECTKYDPDLYNDI